LTGAPNELPASIPALNFSSLMSSTSTTIQPAGTKPLNIDFLSRTSLLILRALLSVHLAEDVEHYLCEVARALKTGGRCLISFFLLNESSLTLMRANNTTINLNINFGSCWVADASDPEAVTGYEEDFVRAVYDRYNFEIKEPIDYGALCGREKFLSYQDLIFAFKSTREYQKSR
jgi:hypothetical protein